MTPPEDPLEDQARLDQQLREALAPSLEQTERIVRRALTARATGESRPAPRLRHLLPAASLLALLVVAAVYFALYPARHRQEAVVSITNVDGMVIATSQEEERPLILSGAGEDQPSGIIIIRHGDPE